MIHLLKFFVILCTLSYVKTKVVSCEDGELACRDKEKCIPESYLCDGGNPDCKDKSDENPVVCENIRIKRGFCGGGKILNSKGNCTNITDACRDFNDLSLFCSKINGLNSNAIIGSLWKEFMVQNNVSLENVGSYNRDTKLEELLEYLAAAFNETIWNKNDPTSCPPLYVNISGRCVALFTITKVNWREAKHFCESISGTLGVFSNLQDFYAILKHLKNQGLETEFWIGGHFEESKCKNISNWIWLDKKDIALGAPFWRMQYSSNCAKRGTTGGCYHYYLSPSENKDGFCVAMDYKYHYYFSDQDCNDKRSPLCVFSRAVPDSSFVGYSDNGLPSDNVVVGKSVIG